MKIIILLIALSLICSSEMCAETGKAIANNGTTYTDLGTGCMKDLHNTVICHKSLENFIPLNITVIGDNFVTYASMGVDTSARACKGIAFDSRNGCFSEIYFKDDCKTETAHYVTDRNGKKHTLNLRKNTTQQAKKICK